MSKPFLSNLLTLSSMGLVSSLILTGITPITQAQNIKDETLVAIKFEAPNNDHVPVTVGGGRRGSITFQSANDQGSSNNVTSGGVRGNITFQSANDQGSSNNVTSGGVRGNITFQSANDQGSSNNVTSGGVRGNVTFESANNQGSSPVVSGGTRAENPLELTALLPENHYGRTVSARPTFFVYLPPNNSQQVFFSIQDEAKNHHYQTILNVSSEGGIITFTLPEEAPELTLNTNYIWYFAPIEENGILRPDNHGVTGWIKRVDEIAVRNNGDIIEKATDYAKSGVWYDTLALLVSAQKQEPNNEIFAKEWHDLLEQVGLENIAQQPISQSL
jgi:hypothetical protein